MRTGYRTVKTVPCPRRYGTVKSWRYRSRRGYGAVNTISFSLLITRLVLTPALTLNDPLRPRSTTAQNN